MGAGRGRPTVHNPELAIEICERLANGESLRAICKSAHIPEESVVRGWARDDRCGFAAQYAKARDAGLDVMADQIIEIADTPQIGLKVETSEDGVKEIREDMLGHRRLQVDTRKWYLSKLAPKRYGDRTAMELTGADGGPVQFSDTERAARIAAILAAAQARKDSDPV